jgi:hypothetical protein
MYLEGSRRSSEELVKEDINLYLDSFLHKNQGDRRWLEELDSNDVQLLFALHSIVIADIQQVTSEQKTLSTVIYVLIGVGGTIFLAAAIGGTIVMYMVWSKKKNKTEEDYSEMEIEE